MAQENTTPKSSNADYESVMAQMETMRADMANMAHNVSQIASRRSHHMAKEMTEGMSDAAHYLGRKGHEADMRVEGAVAANPYLALGLAAGLGALLGALTRR